MHEDLIRRLQDRLTLDPTTDSTCYPPIRPHPPLSDEQVEDVERDLGFALPPLVRALYTQVADGGYGPGYGLLRLNHEDGPSVVDWDRHFRQSWKRGKPPKRWPEPFLRLCEWGCNIYSGVDCSRPECPVLRFDPDRLGESRNLADGLAPEADSLAEWLTAWLDSKNL